MRSGFSSQLHPYILNKIWFFSCDRILKQAIYVPDFSTSQNRVAPNSWYYELLDAIASLKEFPNRCSIAPEAPAIGREIRQLWVGKRRKYRVLFVVSENTVAILHVRNSRQSDLGEESE
ncbi:type II toxin-antitoxin system RelE/ParE family toxin [Nostoc commune]|uniref:type II toxin-antitoxin system RelE/ParE family toxin n=1 Tax=Nostoc commune TaxID=1178 RepID=UPI001FD10FD3|nr:type II toxin-antitoxin system RelE/ParE family toxin [Nostoc commune]